MTISAADDRLHVPATPDGSFRDAVTFSFGDQAAKLYGLARLSHGADGAGGLALLYAGDAPVAACAGSAAASAADSWDGVTAGGVSVEVVQPLEAWNVRFSGDDGAFDLRFEACSAPAELAGDTEVARAGGMHGYDQLCRVTGTATHGGRTHQLRCLGQRGQLWGNPDYSRIALARTVSAWL
ncbi:MAG: hypothetical protein QOE31_1490, partial [Solirubrobacteraceae bacterium]|nr:hypothetical protein [Solirubrobacteraceae bacterium]